MESRWIGMEGKKSWCVGSCSRCGVIYEVRGHGWEDHGLCFRCYVEKVEGAVKLDGRELNNHIALELSEDSPEMEPLTFTADEIDDCMDEVLEDVADTLSLLKKKISRVTR